MKLIINERDGCCESIHIEYTPAEALIINQAMRRYVEDEDMHENDREVMKQMLDVEPIFREIKVESEGKGMYIACKKCKYNYDGECDFYDMGSGNEIDMPCYREKELIKKATDNFIQAFAGTESEEQGCI